MKHTLRALALALGFLPALAVAQAPQFPQNLPANTVVGRLGIGPGPTQAIPFATLSANLTGARITLNSGNGQTAPGAMTGGNTFSFGAITDTPRFAGIGLGGAAPATGLEVYNAPATPTGNGQGMVGASTFNGGVLAGQGSTYDAVIANKSAAVALGVTTGTQNIVLQGTLTAASLSTSGTIAGSLCMTSGGLVLYEAAINCFAVSGITVVSGKTLTVDNTIELAGTDGTKFTFPGASDTVGTLAANQTISGAKTFSGTLNITGAGQINGTAFGTFATQNFATPPAIGGTTPNAGAFSTLSATAPIGLSSGGTNANTAAGARASGGLNIDELTSRGDSNYSILATDRVVGTSAALTASRTWTLPTASSVNAGQTLLVQDFKGFVSNTNTLTIVRNGSDTINGGTGSQTINNANGGFLFVSDGVSNWSAQALGAQATAGVASINGQTGNPSIVAGANVTVSTTGGNISVAAVLPTPALLHLKDASPTVAGNNTTDDTAALQAWMNACATNRLICYLDPPSVCYKITAPLTVTSANGITIMGPGRDKVGSGICLSSTTQNGIVATTLGQINLFGFQITGQAAATAGDMFQLNSGTSSPNQRSTFRDMFFANGFQQTHFVSASGWTIDNCLFAGPNTGGISVFVEDLVQPDAGDQAISNSTFSGNAVASAIIQTSGGGLKVVGNKIINYANGYLLSLVAGVSTSDLFFSANSMEAFTATGISLNKGTGNIFGTVVINGNEINGCATCFSTDVTAGWLNNVIISNNHLSPRSGGTCMDIGTGSGVQVSGNNCEGAGSGDTGIVIHANVTSGLVSNNIFNSSIANRYSFASTGVQLVDYNGSVTITNSLSTIGNGSQVFTSDGSPGSAPCSGGSTGSMAFRQNGAWKCF